MNNNTIAPRAKTQLQMDRDYVDEADIYLAFRCQVRTLYSTSNNTVNNNEKNKVFAQRAKAQLQMYRAYVDEADIYLAFRCQVRDNGNKNMFILCRVTVLIVKSARHAPRRNCKWAETTWTKRTYTYPSDAR